MKKLKLFFACLLMAVLSIGQVWGENVTFTFPSSSDLLGWSADPSPTFESANLARGLAWSKNAMSMTYTLDGYGISHVKVVASTNNAGNYTLSVNGGTGQAVTKDNNKDYDFDVEVADGGTVTISTTYTGSGKSFWIKSIVFTKASSGGTVAVTGVELDESAITLNEEETQTLTATVSPENASNKNVTWESDDESVATVSNGVVTAVGAGDATITCKSVADETKYAECAVHVNASPYTKSTLIFTAACGGSGTSDKGHEWDVESDGTESAFDSNKGIHYGTGSAEVQYITLSTSDITGTIAKVVVNASTASGVSATVDVTVGGAAFGGDAKALSATATDYAFTGSATGEIIVTVTKPSSATKAIYVKSVVVSYIPAAIEVKKPTFSVAGGSYLDAQNVVITCEPADASIFYTLDESDPSSASTPYTSAITISETTTLKAIAIKDEVSSPIATAVYTITTPLSVTDALALIPNANDQVNDRYVEGFVCTEAPEVLTGGKMTYYISADGTETNRLQIYKGKNLDNAGFSNVSDAAKGDKVIVYGQLYNFGGTNKEMNDGNYIVRRTAKGALQSVVVSGTPTKTAYSSGDAFEPAGLVVTATYASGYAVNVASELAAADWSASPATVTEAGNISVTATYGGMTSDAYPVPVTVLTATLESITLSYSEVEVYQGKPLPKPVVTAHWSDATTSDVTALATFTGYDASTTGDQTITVSYKVSEGDDPEQETYTVTVKPIYGVELAASVAKDLIETVVGNTESTSDMIVRGKVSSVGSINSKCLTYFISDDGTTTNQLEIFKGKYLDNADFTDGNKLKEGDEVVVTGKVIYYNGTTAEFASGKSQVTSLARTPNFSIIDVASFEVGSADLAVADLTINVEGEGAVTFASSDNTDAVTIVDGKLHAVAQGAAVITANLAASGIYKAASTTFNVTVVPQPTKYTITFDSNGADGGDAPAAIANQAAGADVPLPANTWTKTDKVFDGWKVTYVDGESVVHEVPVAANVFTMPAYNVTVQAQWAEIPYWATVYDNITGVTVAHTGSGADDGTITISTKSHNLVKAGASSNTGTIKVTVPEGTTDLHFHAFAWGGKTAQIQLAGVDNPSVSEFDLAGEAGASGSGNDFTLQGNPVDQYFHVSFDAVAAETEIVFSKTSSSADNRFFFYGVNQVGGAVPELKSIAFTEAAATKLAYEVGDVFNPAGLVVEAVFTVGGVDQDATEVDAADIDWSFDPATLALETTSVEVTASYTFGSVTKTAKKTVNGITVTDPTPRFETSPASISFGSVDQGGSVAAKTINVYLKYIDEATVSLGGSNPDAYSIDVTELNADGVVSVSVNSTATAGSYPAKLILTDKAGVAQTAEISISLTVNAAETSVSTTSKWIPATEITDGMEVLITGVKESVTYAMGAQANNNRTCVAGTLEEGVFTPGEGTKSFILVAQGDGSYAIKTSTDKYLYAASSTANQLKTRDAIGEDGNANWTISVTSASANGANRGVMRFNTNGNNNPLIACYEDDTKQLAIAFYVPKPVTKYMVTFDKNDGSATTSVEVNAGEKVAKPADPIREGFTFNYWTLNSVEYDFDASVTEDITLVADWTENPAPSYETVRTGLEVNRYYTVCLPKKVTAIKGASFWTLNNKSQDGATAYLEEETNNLPFAAGKPFIIQATAENLEVVYEGDATEVAGTNGALHGTLVYMDAAALAAAGSNVYMLYNNVLRPVGENNHLDANRAYVKVDELDPVSSVPQGAPGKRVIAMPMQKDEAQGFENLDASEKPLKVMIDGTLYILRGEKVYDATGRLVK